MYYEKRSPGLEYDAYRVYGFPFFISCKQEEKSVPVKDEIYVAAYVWPSCHYEERNAEMLWPEGMGEWEVIRKGTPRFAGHYQPKIPLWGYEMDDDPEVMERWIDAATDHGINVFIFDWLRTDGEQNEHNSAGHSAIPEV